MSKDLCDSPSERIRPLKNLNGADKLLLNEIFFSIQGESTFAGLPCVFVRTTACHLRCSYCDTEHAFYEGKEWSIKDILTRVEGYGAPLVELTGGEPLLQPGSLLLLKELCDRGFQVLLETSGAVSIKNVDRRVKVILDVKTPGSGEEKRNHWANLSLLWPGCEIKFVICDSKDYLFAKDTMKRHHIFSEIPVLFSPVSNGVIAQDLASWILRDRLAGRLQLQLHRILWGEKTGV